MTLTMISIYVRIVL